MNKVVANSRLTAVIHKADGTVVPLGVVGYYSSNPFKRFLYRWFGVAI